MSSYNPLTSIVKLAVVQTNTCAIAWDLFETG